MHEIADIKKFSIENYLLMAFPTCRAGFNFYCTFCHFRKKRKKGKSNTTVIQMYKLARQVVPDLIVSLCPLGNEKFDEFQRILSFDKASSVKKDGD